MKIELFGLSAEEIGAEVSCYGLERYRGRQIARWLYQRGVREFSAMSDLSKEQRERLAEDFALCQVEVATEEHAADQLTSKYLLAFPDGQAVETVLMRHHHGNSVCVSSQVGCAMGCVFCASTIDGVVRNLTCGEMLAQVVGMNTVLAQKDSRVDSVVIMGSGEPLANYEQVVSFIRLCHTRDCLNMSYRSFTLSTVGIVPGIYRLAEEGLPITLAISLHAPNNGVRSKLIPLNSQYPLEEVMAAADHYADKTGRRVTYEYALIAGINDREEDARQLASLVRGRLANINLIPVNDVPERNLLRPNPAVIKRFYEILTTARVNTTIRREMGQDIKAACGQLRRRQQVGPAKA